MEMDVNPDSRLNLGHDVSYHDLIPDKLGLVLLATNDDGTVFGLVAKLVKSSLQLLPLLAAGQVGQERFILDLKVFELNVGLGHHRGDGPSTQPGKTRSRVD